jgi:hypothetical protein
MVISVAQTKNGKETVEKQEIVYSVASYPYDAIALSCNTVRKKGRNGLTYIATPATFDIESTTIDGEKPEAFMYHWQFCLNGKVCFGRTWEEWINFMHKLGTTLELDAKKVLVIYVHNLAYEFMFIKDFLHIESLFAREAHKVIKVLACLGNDYGKSINKVGNVSRETFLLPFFEFRCSYFLSNMSLSKFCKNSKFCTHYKLVDTYDYRKIRTPSTPMTEEELAYCYNDVKGLEECILSKLDDECDTLATIPLTSTGYVRREMRAECRKYPEYRELFEILMPTAQIYTLLRQAFRGGNTHASRYYADAVIEGVYSKDRVSSYPACIVSDLYPMTPFIPYEPKSYAQLIADCGKKKNAIIMRITLFDLDLHDDVTVPYIDFAHCIAYSKNYVNDNGRVLSADWIIYACTELDFLIINNQYRYDTTRLEWLEGYKAEKDYLPKPIVDTALFYYDKKTQLKDVSGKEYEYAKSKNKANSVFGVMVTDICQGEIEYIDGTWSKIMPDKESAIASYAASKNSFLLYQWGVYITANARYELQCMIDACGYDFVYADTDSVKFIGKKHLKSFDDRNNYLLSKKQKYRNYSDRLNDDGTTTRYTLGVWDDDGFYKKFKTLGAKKYAYISDDKNKKTGEIKKDVLHVTVSGLSKDKGAAELARGNGLDDFKIGKIFTDSGRTVSYFNERDVHTIKVVDYYGKECEFTTASNIAIVDTTYTLGISDEYAAVLGSCINFSE